MTATWAGVGLLYGAALMGFIIRPADDAAVGYTLLAIAVVTHAGALFALREPVTVPRERRPRFW